MKFSGIISVIIFALSAVFQASSQQSVVIPPLFEYPVAPEELPDLESKSNFLVTNFWRSFDFNSKEPISQVQLNHAFKVFTVPMRWGTPKVVYDAVDEIVKKMKKNPTLLYQFTVAAEENLYGERAEVWIDDVYLKFVDALLANKKIKTSRKTRFKAQKENLDGSLKGHKLEDFSFHTPNGETKSFAPSTPLTILEFGSPSCPDCRMAKLKFDTNSDLNKLISDGKLSIVFIIPDAESEDDWQKELSSYPENWTKGAGDDLDIRFDMRLVPSIYLIDSEGKIVNKNITADEAIAEAINYLK